MERHIETERSAAGISTWYILQGQKGAVQFLILDCKVVSRFYDFGIHSLEPLSPGQESMGECRYLDGLCYFISNGQVGQRIYDEFMADEDPEHLWRLLEDCYAEYFG